MPRRGRKILAGQERVADRRNIAEPFDHAIDRQRRDLRGVIFRQYMLILQDFLALRYCYPLAYPLICLVEVRVVKSAVRGT